MTRLQTRSVAQRDPKAQGISPRYREHPHSSEQGWQVSSAATPGVESAQFAHEVHSKRWRAWIPLAACLAAGAALLAIVGGSPPGDTAQAVLDAERSMAAAPVHALDTFGSNVEYEPALRWSWPELTLLTDPAGFIACDRSRTSGLEQC